MKEPLAVRLRPTCLSEIAGQRHLFEEGAPLRALIDAGRMTNMIFYGPSGTGKTTTATVLAKQSGMRFFRLNATTAGSADIREVLRESDGFAADGGVLLYLDEIQYLNRKQQQTLLEYIEDGRVTLIASTTENPYFYIYKALLSRSAVFEFKPLSPEDVRPVLTRAMARLNGEEGTEKRLSDEAAEVIASSSGGDVRASLGALELCYFAAGDGEITEAIARRVCPKSYLSFDREGDDRYELMSALQKSIRGSDPDAAVFYLAKLLESGDLVSPCRRLLVIASEDVGLAFPQAAAIVKACVDSALQLGLPEARIPLSEAALLLATAPKSNSAEAAIDAALADVRASKGREMPSYLRENHTFGVGETKGRYRYPHDYPEHWVDQQYLPDDLKDRKYYHFGENKTEQAARAFWAAVKKDKLK
ncbi:MAG: replication-associated recombination protein A [Clostridia bacterium]|nr:replication-associated recombination protein A [Clostridia bacterium]